MIFQPGTRGDTLSVDEGAVQTAQVFDVELPALRQNASMLPRDAAQGQDHIAKSIATEHSLPIGKLVPLPSRGAVKDFKYGHVTANNPVCDLAVARQPSTVEAH